MNEKYDAVVSAATSCLLYVRENGRSGLGECPVAYSNELINRWLSSAERRNLHSRQCLRSIRTILKQARKCRQPDFKSVMHLLVEGNGVIPDVTVSDLGNVQSIRNELIGLGWWVKFGVPLDWQRINLQHRPVSFGLLSDLNRCFRHDGQQAEPLPLYTTGNSDELRKVLKKYSYRLRIASSEVVEDVTVLRCFIETGVMNVQ